MDQYNERVREYYKQFELGGVFSFTHWLLKSNNFLDEYISYMGDQYTPEDLIDLMKDTDAIFNNICRNRSMDNNRDSDRYNIGTLLKLLTNNKIQRELLNRSFNNTYSINSYNFEYSLANLIGNYAVNRADKYRLAMDAIKKDAIIISNLEMFTIALKGIHSLGGSPYPLKIDSDIGDNLARLYNEEIKRTNFFRPSSGEDIFNFIINSSDRGYSPLSPNFLFGNRFNIIPMLSDKKQFINSTMTWSRTEQERSRESYLKSRVFQNMVGSWSKVNSTLETGLKRVRDSSTIIDCLLTDLPSEAGRYKNTLNIRHAFDNICLLPQTDLSVVEMIKSQLTFSRINIEDEQEIDCFRDAI